MTNVILWNLDLLVSSISSRHSAAFTLNPRQTSCFCEFFSVIYFLECPCDSLANSQKGLASLGLGENELECHLLNIHWHAMKDFILTLTTVYWKCLLLICLLKKTMSFSGAVPYLTCFSIPVPSLVTGAKMFPRSAYCMNEDKVFAWKSESISPSIMSDSFVIPWTVSCQAPCPWSSPGKDTRVGSRSLLQGIFLTHGWNPGLLNCRQILHWFPSNHPLLQKPHHL